jgi:hypothetical protein
MCRRTVLCPTKRSCTLTCNSLAFTCLGVIRCRYAQCVRWFQAGAIRMTGDPWLTWHAIIGDGLPSLSAHVLQGCFSTRSPLRHSLARFQNPQIKLTAKIKRWSAVVCKWPLACTCRRGHKEPASTVWDARQFQQNKQLRTVPNILHSPFVIQVLLLYYLHLQHSYSIYLC